ncbi:DUF2637 domain-containing protein [Micromonospora sp. WMMD754]|uniref:DUF2637 domain-containing protein n=1 Tax=Micromonospora sp. WMMD754 TaxID=3404114 RepID=UPI003BF4734F
MRLDRLGGGGPVNWPKIRTIAFGVLAGVVASAGTIAVTVAGFALSYDAIRAVGIASRIRTEWAWLLPVSVDGAMAVATIAAVVLRRLTGKTEWYPWAVVLVGAAISIACNGLHAIPPAGAALVIEEREVRFAVSAIPAVMLALSVHLLVTLVEAASVFGGSGPAQRTAAVDQPAEVHVVPEPLVVDPEPVDPWQWSTPVHAEPVHTEPAPVHTPPVHTPPVHIPAKRSTAPKRAVRSTRSTPQREPAPRVLAMVDQLWVDHPADQDGPESVSRVVNRYGWRKADATEAVRIYRKQRESQGGPVHVPDSPAELDQISA